MGSSVHVGVTNQQLIIVRPRSVVGRRSDQDHSSQHQCPFMSGEAEVAGQKNTGLS